VPLVGARKIIAFAIMCLGMFIALVDIQIVSASLREIGGGLSAGSDETAWVQTAYLIAEIVVIPLSGWLSRVFSTRWLFSASAIGFTIASLLCGFAWDIHSMIAFRALQGFLGGSMIPMVFTMAFVFFDNKQRVIAASSIGAIASLAPTLGPTLGGWITDHWSWQWLFFVNVVPGLVVAIGVYKMVTIDKPDLSLLRGADYLGIVLLALFLGCLEYTLEEGPRWNWFSDSTITATAWIAALGGIAFIWRTLTFAQPLMDLRALKDRNFALGSLFSFVTGVFQIITVPIYAWLARRFDLRWILMFGLALFALSMWEFAPITHDWGARELLFPQALRGAAQQLSVAPTVVLTLGSLPPLRLKLASGLFNTMRNLGGAIGIALCATILNDRTNLHFQRMADHLNYTNEAMDGWIATTATRLGTMDAQAVLRPLWQVTYREAQTLAYSDAFLVIMC